jgi:hypothetical protein
LIDLIRIYEIPAPALTGGAGIIDIVKRSIIEGVPRELGRATCSCCV